MMTACLFSMKEGVFPLPARPKWFYITLLLVHFFVFSVYYIVRWNGKWFEERLAMEPSPKREVARRRDTEELRDRTTYRAVASLAPTTQASAEDAILD